MLETKSSFNWKIAGQAGHGVMLASQLMAKIAKRHGMQVFNYLEYPSLIRGGHQTGQVYADFNNATCQQQTLDLLVVYTQDSFELHRSEISEKTIIIYNSDFGELAQEISDKYQDKVFQMPLSSWAKEKTGTTLAANIVSLGVSSAVLGLDLEIAKQVIASAFAKQEVIDKNLQALDYGFIEAQKIIEPLFNFSSQEDNNILVNGNEAIGLGALAAGAQFYSAYPMTPATGLLHFFNEHKDKLPLMVKQAGDEIEAINQAIGASMAGVRAMTGSSGGGFALKVESLSYAGTAEIPLVILEAQRTGPATGVPTWTAQSDLLFVLNAGHGDFPKVVLTPGTVEEHFKLTKTAFYLAEKYQLPVIILSDKYILESHQTMPVIEEKQHNQRHSMVKTEELASDESYLRYLDTENGISPRSIPGQEFGLQLTNSYEHDQWGFATEDAKEIKKSVKKRERKIKTLLAEVPQPQLIGDPEAQITLVVWGSTVNVVLQLMHLAKTVDEKLVNVIHIPCMLPFPAEAFKQLADQANKLVMVESNVSGQGEKWIRQQTGVSMDDHIRRYDGRPFYVEDLLDLIQDKLA
jgi:2-oxoglutarate/2-oxoacid ferredoxin oxidoreductase subunit alpha